MSWFHALTVLLNVLHAHRLPIYHWATYGYGANGGFAHSNSGVYVDLGHGRCVGYEIRGERGFFGNAYGLHGGDCK